MKSQSKAEKKAAGTSHTSSRADGRSVTWSDEDLRQEGPSLWQVQRALASLLSKVRSEVINVHLVYELSHACDHTHTHNGLTPVRHPVLAGPGGAQGDGNGDASSQDST